MLGMMPSLKNFLPGVERATLFSQVLSGALLGGLFLLSALYALRRLTGREGTLPWHGHWMRLHRAALVLAPLVFVLALALGWLVQNHSPWDWVFFPLAHVATVVAPVWWWLAVGSCRLHLDLSPQRRWGLVTAGLSLGPLVSILTEVALLVAGVGGLALFLANNPQVASRLEVLGRRLVFSGGNPRAVERISRAVFSEFSWLVFLGMAGIGVIGPLLEEIFKPLGVWLLMGRGLSPSEGFLAGMISGGMFSLIEGLFSGVAERWGFVVAGRVGTTLMHVAASGLVGYALVSAWEKRRYLQLGGAYLLAVSLHGLWNMSVVVLAASASLQISGFITSLGGVVLVLVVLGCLVILGRLGRSVAGADGERPISARTEKGNETYGLVDDTD